MGKKKQSELDEMELLQQEFWNRMREIFKENGTALQLGDTDYGEWINCKTSVRQNLIVVYLRPLHRRYQITANLDGRKNATEYSEQWATYMMHHKQEIENNIGFPIEQFEQLPTSGGVGAEMRIGKEFEMHPLHKKEKWGALISVMRVQLYSYVKAFEPHMEAFAETHGYLLDDGSVRHHR